MAVEGATEAGPVVATMAVPGCSRAGCNVGGEVGEGEPGALGENDHVLDGVFEFADVAGPGVGHEGVAGVGVDAVDVLCRCFSVLRAMKWLMSRGMSSRRWRSGGSSMTAPLMRK